MKLRAKSQNEVVADLVEKVISLEQDMEDLVEVIAKRDEMILGIKKEMSEMNESMLKEISKRDEMLKSQAEGLKVLAESMKRRGVSSGDNALRKKDLQYLAKLISDGKYMQSKSKSRQNKQEKKQGIIEKIFG